MQIKEKRKTEIIYDVEPKHCNFVALATMHSLDFDTDKKKVRFKNEVVGNIRKWNEHTVSFFIPHGWKEWFQWRFLNRLGL